MKIKSLIRENELLVPVEVEVQLQLGLPQIIFVGLADQQIKESAIRIKSAIKNSGFIFPKAHQVIVNLRSNLDKKSSRGVELAVALAILWETDQLQKYVLDSSVYIYGELSLGGEIYEPADLHQGLKIDHQPIVITGETTVCKALFQREIIKRLDAFHDRVTMFPDIHAHWQRPLEGLKFSFPEKIAHWLKIISLSEGHVLLSGASGSGKTTLAKSIVSFLEEPQVPVYWTTQQTWRPYVKPHHSATALSLLGGGAPPKMGEVSKAHDGLLVMDEFFEFDPVVQDSLREPMEEGRIRLSRSHYQTEYLAHFSLIATTNLCPCGNWVPGKPLSCRYSRKKCLSYSEKLSGPLLDRFHFAFYFEDIRNHSNSENYISGENLLNDLEKVRAWEHRMNLRVRMKNQSGDKIAEQFFKRAHHPVILEEVKTLNWGSQRRFNSALQLAMVIANLDFSEEIRLSHWTQAIDFAVFNLRRLQNWN